MGFISPDVCEICGAQETSDNKMWLIGYFKDIAAEKLSKMMLCEHCYRVVGAAMIQPLEQRKAMLEAEKKANAKTDS